MAVSRGSTISSDQDSSTPLIATLSHTVDASTTLLLVTFHCEGNNSISSVAWNTSETMTLVSSVTSSSSGGDVRVYVFALVNPTTGAHSVTWTVGGSGDNLSVVAINYLGTVTSSVANATNEIDTEDNGNNASQTVALSGTTTSGACLAIAGTFRGGDGDPGTESNDGNFADVDTGASGTSSFSDTSYYVGDDVDGGTGGTVSPTIDWTGSANDECVGVFIEILPAASTPAISSLDSDYGDASDEFDFDEDSLDINGTNLDLVDEVYFSDASTLAGSANEVDISAAINTQSASLINLDLTALGSTAIAAMESLGPGARYIIVVDTDGGPDEDGYAATAHRAKAFNLAASSNITASGENTSAYMTPPSGKTTGDFGGGRIQDDENPGDAVDLASDEYREDEWCISAVDPSDGTYLGAQDGETYQFRVLIDGSVIDTYTVTPQWTIGSAGTEYDETGLQTTISSTTTLSDALTNDETGHQTDITASTSLTDTVAGTETPTTTITATTTLSDAVSGDETGLATTITSTTSLTDTLTHKLFELGLATTITATTTLVDTQAMVENPQTTGTVTSVLTDTQAMVELALLTDITATTTLVDDLSGTFSELALLTTITATTTLVDDLHFTYEELALLSTITSTTTLADLLSGTESLATLILATVDTSSRLNAYGYTGGASRAATRYGPSNAPGADVRTGTAPNVGSETKVSE